MTEKELKKHSALRQRIIAEKEKALSKAVDDMQRTLVNDIFDGVLKKMEVEEGVIKSTQNNIRLSAAIDAIYSKFINAEMVPTAQQMVRDYSSIFTANRSYFDTFGRTQKVIDTISDSVEKQMRLYVGVDAKGKTIPGGFLDNFIHDETLRNQIKNRTLMSVTQGVPVAEFVRTIEETVIGTDKIDGGLQRHFKTFAYDSYSIFDAATNNGFADQLGLMYAVYAGGLIETSRPFCTARNNKVFTRAEIEKFGTSADKYGGYTDKKKGEFAGKTKPYNPFTDRGGYNCRHIYNWITKQLAVMLRPDLADAM